MDEDIAIIDSRTRIEKIKNFFALNKKLVITLVVSVIIIFLGYFSFTEFKDKKKIEISDIYNSTIIKYTEANKDNTAEVLTELVNKKDSTYSPLSLYFIIDNSLIKDNKKINDLFDILILETSLEKEIKNLIIYKKALFNADSSDENQLLNILNPLINSSSIWKSHALYLMAEFFYAKNEREKSKEFFGKILNVENANKDILLEAQKRLNRDLSE